MKIEYEGTTLKLSGVNELGPANSQDFRDRVKEALREDTRGIDFDLHETTYMDATGIGALLSLHKAMSARQGTFRLLYPTPQVRQVLELTEMHRVFNVVTQ